MGLLNAMKEQRYEKRRERLQGKKLGILWRVEKYFDMVNVPSRNAVSRQQPASALKSASRSRTLDDD